MTFEKHLISEFVDSITDTTPITDDSVILVNTSDVENWKVINHEYTENKNLKGQFKKRFKKWDILYSEIRPKNRRFAYVDFDSNDYLASTKLMVLRNKWNIDNMFLYYILTSDDLINKLQIQAESRSWTFPQITFDVLKNNVVNIPSKDLQIKISKILSKIDNKIELNNQINHNLNEIIKKNYEEIIEKIDETIPLWDIMVITSGKWCKKNQVKTEENKIEIAGASWIIWYTNCSNYDENYIIIWRVGTLWEVKRYNYPIWASDNTLVIQTEYLNYVECFLKTVDYKSLNRWSSQPLITQWDMKEVKIPFKKEYCIEFESKNKILRDKIFANDEENRTLWNIRDTLLPKLMSWEIDLDKVTI